MVRLEDKMNSEKLKRGRTAVESVAEELRDLIYKKEFYTDLAKYNGQPPEIIVDMCNDISAQKELPDTLFCHRIIIGYELDDKGRIIPGPYIMHSVWSKRIVKKRDGQKQGSSHPKGYPIAISEADFLTIINARLDYERAVETARRTINNIETFATHRGIPYRFAYHPILPEQKKESFE